MTKEEMIAEIYRLDSSYRRLNIDLDKYSEAEIEKHYLRKKNAPASIKARNTGGWYANFQSRPRKSEQRTDGFEVVESMQSTQPKQHRVDMDICGFNTIKKEDIFKKGDQNESSVCLYRL